MTQIHPSDATIDQLGTLLPRALHLLDERGGALLDGTFELCDAWVVNSLFEALTSVAQGAFPEDATLEESSFGEMPDEDLQEYAAALIARSAAQPAGMQGMLGSLGTLTAESMAMQAEDWQVRYTASIDAERAADHEDA